MYYYVLHCGGESRTTRGQNIAQGRSRADFSSFLPSFLEIFQQQQQQQQAAAEAALPLPALPILKAEKDVPNSPAKYASSSTLSVAQSFLHAV